MKKILLSLLILVPLSGFSFLCSDDDKTYNQEYLDKPAGLLGYWGEDKVLYKVKEFAKNDLESVNKSKVTITSIRLMEPYCSHDEYYVPKGYKYSDIKMVYEVSFYFSDFPDIKAPVFHIYITELNTHELFVQSGDELIGFITVSKLRQYISEKVVGKYFKDYSAGYSSDFEDNLKGIKTNNLELVYSSPSKIVSEARKHEFNYAFSAEITIYNTPKTVENLAKAIQMSKELYNFLYDLSSSHRVGSISVSLYDGTKEDLNNWKKINKTEFISYDKKEGDTVYSYWYDNWWGGVAFNGCSNLRKFETKLCGNKLLDNSYLLDETYIVKHKTKRFKEDNGIPLTQTELYPEVTKILKEEK